jgi:bifunctional DNase/RNase
MASEQAKSAAGDIEVQIRGLMLDPVTNMPIVVLKDIAGEMVLPIWVGVFEANAIALELEKSTTPRPMTHDLLRNIARGLGGRVDKIVVSDLREDTFYATIWMTQGDEQVTLDARPSDAIALALRWDCPIFVSAAVLGKARPEKAEAEVNVDAEELRKWLENLNEDDTGRYKM